ncbi:MAG: hypothetical protein ACJATT_005104 [Myxococcota bacterium]|jgi:hypothetical protein
MSRIFLVGTLVIAGACGTQRSIHLTLDDLDDLDRGFACGDDSITLTNALATVRAQVFDLPFNDDPVVWVVFTGVDLINVFDDNLCDDAMIVGNTFQSVDFGYTMTSGSVTLLSTDDGVRFEATDAVLTPDPVYDELSEASASDASAVDVGGFASDIVVRAGLPEDTLPR